ncbi:zinc ribbon domain-containing protein [Chitinilyticum aquatile]|uniref:zinc ribbon domain-containing protein n=1 Tax=Chitinilyticum aquatile TaxID=362520 RepID=UPI0006870DB3|nr:zinc ribbon domain-containing protein [Chitinilyticum aquatile]
MSNQAVPQASGFTLFLMRAGQITAIGFAILALLGFLGAMGYVVSRTGDSFKVPDFAKVQEEGELRSFSRAQSDVAAQEEIVKLNTKYGEQILEIIKTYGVKEITTENVIRALVNIPEDRRGQLLDGWEDFLEDGLKYYRKSGQFTDQTPDQLSEYYFARFNNSLSQTAAAKQVAQVERISGITVALGSLIAFIVAMLIPILVQIERNTRASRMALEGTPAVTPVATKPAAKTETAKAATPAATVTPAVPVAAAAATAAAPAPATTPAESKPVAKPAAPAPAPAPAPAVSQTASVACPECKTGNEAHAAFCGECGCKLSPA